MTKPTGKPRGRPPSRGETMVHVTMRLLPDEAAKLRYLGRQWLVARLAKAPKPPTESNLP